MSDAQINAIKLLFFKLAIKIDSHFQFIDSGQSPFQLINYGQSPFQSITTTAV